MKPKGIVKQMIRGFFLLLLMIIIGLATAGVVSMMKAVVVLGCCLLCVASLMLGASIMWYSMMSESNPYMEDEVL